MHTTRNWWVLLMPLILAACGGGGGGDAPSGASPAVTSTNARAAWRSLLATQRVVSVSGTGSDSASYQLSVTIQPLGATTVNATQVQQVNFSSVLNRNSVLNTSSSFDLYVLSGTGNTYAYRDPTGDCSLFSGSVEPPESLSVIGQSGPLYSGTVVVGCNSINGIPVVTGGTLSGTWFIQSEAALTFFCVEARLADVLMTSQTSCLEVIDTAGTFGTRARVTLTQGSSPSLVLRNY